MSGSSASLISKLLPSGCRSISQAITSGQPSIAKINKQDPVIANSVLVEFITDMVEFLNVGKIMNPPQIEQTAVYVLQYFPHLNLADLKLFFDKMKLGHYGKFYDSVDGQLILSKMEEYSQDRMNEFEQIRMRQHKDDLKNNPIGSGYHPNVVEAMRKAVGQKKPFQIDEKEKPPLSEAQMFHQRCLRQFDNLYIKYGAQLSSIRFLVFGKKRYSIETFLERKIINRENFYNQEYE
ncbi:DUF6633 family protein [Sphingobacterium sp. UT-1RO-CII-1]|uniref:DUF6633 family protein n=1 Tax=Sphingobacterium sp. UT-1RO-CII-1 TaxID=2995225 RepID=UPI002DD43EEA|nr:DUF6633 family protein [Sphingobacterium sp. UT-1RO-CII-1]